MPTLGKVRGKIVFLSRSDFKYNKSYINFSDFDDPNEAPKELDTYDTPIGFLRDIKDKGKCSSMPIPILFEGIHEDVCKVEEIGNFRYQDNYQLAPSVKWTFVTKMILEESKFNDKTNSLVHTLNFMNTAFVNNLPISEGAPYMNKELTNLLNHQPAPNEWFVLDFPTGDVIRAIYDSNFETVSNIVKLLDYNFDDEIDELVNAFTGVYDIVVDLIDDTVDLAKDVANGIANFLDDTVDLVKEGFSLTKSTRYSKN
jgi:hypothetical protein